MNFENLTPTSRELMIKEITEDIESDSLYKATRLSKVGMSDYPNLLIEACRENDEQWLANELNSSNRLNLTELRKTKNGTTKVKVPSNAHTVLVEGEFNRYYIRAVCLQNIGGTVEIYRAKTVSNPRSSSESKIGIKVDASDLLADLRSSIGVDTALGLPSGPNSGLSAKFQ